MSLAKGADWPDIFNSNMCQQKGKKNVRDYVYDCIPRQDITASIATSMSLNWREYF